MIQNPDEKAVATVLIVRGVSGLCLHKPVMEMDTFENLHNIK